MRLACPFLKDPDGCQKPIILRPGFSVFPTKVLKPILPQNIAEPQPTGTLHGLLTVVKRTKWGSVSVPGMVDLEPLNKLQDPQRKRFFPPLASARLLLLQLVTCSTSEQTPSALASALCGGSCHSYLGIGHAGSLAS